MIVYWPMSIPTSYQRQGSGKFARVQQSDFPLLFFIQWFRPIEQLFSSALLSEGLQDRALTTQNEFVGSVTTVDHGNTKKEGNIVIVR